MPQNIENLIVATAIVLVSAIVVFGLRGCVVEKIRSETELKVKCIEASGIWDSERGCIAAPKVGA